MKSNQITILKFRAFIFLTIQKAGAYIDLKRFNQMKISIFCFCVCVWGLLIVITFAEIMKHSKEYHKVRYIFIVNMVFIF